MGVGREDLLAVWVVRPEARAASGTVSIGGHVRTSTGGTLIEVMLFASTIGASPELLVRSFEMAAPNP